MALVVVGVCLVALIGALVEASSETHVAFPATIPTQQSSPADFLPVSVKVSRGSVGQTTTIGLKRGGEATSVSAASNSSEGFVGFRKPDGGAARSVAARATNSSAGLAAGSGPRP